MMLTAIALAFAANSAPLPARPGAATVDGQTIVVTATPLAETQRRLADCLARRCPPGEDIEASAAHAENLFVAGRYNDANTVLQQSIGRNRRHARDLPVPVASLFRAHSRVAAHLGEGNQYRSSSYDIVRSLRAGLPSSDARIIAARFEVAAMQLSLGKYDLAAQSYRDIEKQANAIRRGDFARLARMRGAYLSYLQGDRSGARATLNAMARDASPDSRVSRIGSLVLLSRLDRVEGRKGDTDALIAELKLAKLDKPVLLYSPPLELKRSPVQEEGEAGNALRLMATDNFDKTWIDVGYWVEGDGRVRDVELLRSAGSTDWAKPLIASIRQRIYAPLADPGGSYRVERFSYTSLWEQRLGTRLRQRSASARVESLDLSAD